MRAESRLERVPLLRAVPDAPAMRRVSAAASAGAYDADDEVREPSQRGSFIRLFAFLLAMGVLGIAIAVAWRLMGTNGARLWPSFMSSPSTVAGGPESPAVTIDRLSKDVAALKATVDGLTASQRELSAALTALHAGGDRRQDDLHPNGSTAASPSGSAYSNALSTNAPPPPSSAPFAQAPRPAPAVRPAAPTPAAPAPQPARPPVNDVPSGLPLWRP